MLYKHAVGTAQQFVSILLTVTTAASLLFSSCPWLLDHDMPKVLHLTMIHLQTAASIWPAMHQC